MQTVVSPLTVKRGPRSKQLGRSPLKSYKIKSKNLTFSLTRGPGAGSATITNGLTGQIEMKVVNEFTLKRCWERERGREGCRERERERLEVRGEKERRLVVRWKCLFSHFKVPSSVCVFKINRPCDEQPVPCWKYILWNTTVLCRKPAKHWLGSIELQLYCSVKQREKYTFAPLFKRCHFYLRASTSTRIEAFSSL